MQYPYTLPSQYDTNALHALVAGKNLPGFQGFGFEGSSLLALFASPLSDTDKATLDSTIAGYAYEAPMPPPNYDAAEAAIHADPILDDIVMGAFFGDSKGRGNLLLASIEFAAKSGDYTRVNRVYADMAKNPPVGMTTENMKVIAQHFVDNGFTQIEV